ncbi:hypothetical protein DIPPA_15881 [Diplonema papillatum]|nr:hypothetical protein DIPPA_15881 [Diplonema papillatum]
MQYHRAAPPRAMLTKRAATMAMEEHEQVMGRLASAAYAQGGARSVHKRCTAPLDDMPTARVDYSVVERGLSGWERSALRAYSEEPMMSDAKGASSMTSGTKASFVSDTRSVIASQKQWQASHAEWCTTKAKAETALLSAIRRRTTLGWPRWSCETKHGPRRSLPGRRRPQRRAAVAGQRNRDGYKRALVEEEYQAARECQSEMRRNRRIIEEELRLEAELSREEAASKLQKSRDRISEAQRSHALLSFERRSAELRKSARELELEAKKNAWQAAETEQAALILSALNTSGGETTLLADAASSPQAAVLLRDVQRAACP